LAVTIYKYESDFSLVNLSYWATTVGGFGSVLATVLLYLTYKSQQKELKATTRALRLQKVDSAFFSMLEMLERIIQGMIGEFVVKRSPTEGATYGTFEGRKYLQQVVIMLQGIYAGDKEIKEYNVDLVNGKLVNVKNEEEEPKTLEELRQDVGSVFTAMFDLYKENLSHYFRYVYNIIKFIDQNQLGDFETRRYLNILQAQLSQDELCLLFYDSISAVGRKANGQYQFAEWLAKYDIISNIDPDSVFKDYHHWLHPHAMFKNLFNDDDPIIKMRALYAERFINKRRNEFS
jgi:hypothetical protein